MTFDRPVEAWDVDATRDKLRARADFCLDESLREIDRDLVAMRMYIRVLEEDLDEAQKQIDKWRLRTKLARPDDPDWWRHY